MKKWEKNSYEPQKELIKYEKKVVNYKISKGSILGKFNGFTIEYPNKSGYKVNIYIGIRLSYDDCSSNYLYLTFEERLKGLTLSDKYPKYKNEIQEMIDLGCEELFEERGFLSGEMRCRRNLSNTYYSLKFYRNLPKTSDINNKYKKELIYKMFKLEKELRVINFTQKYPKGEFCESICLKTELHYRSGVIHVLDLNLSELSRGLTLEEKYNGLKYTLDYFGEDNLAENLRNNLVNNEKSKKDKKWGIKIDVIEQDDYYAIDKDEGLFIDKMYLTLDEIDRGLTFEEKYNKNIYDWYPR